MVTHTYCAVSDVQVTILKKVSELASDNVEAVELAQLAKKISRAYALLVLDKQMKINMCRTKERRQQNEC